MQIYVNILCIFVLSVLALLVRNSVFMDERRNKMYLHAIIFNIYVLIGYVGRDIAETYRLIPLSYFSNTLIYCSGCTIVFCLLLTDVKKGRKIYTIAVTMEAIYIAMSITSPWTHLMFQIDENGIYSRGIFAESLFIVAICMLLMWLFCLYKGYRNIEGKKMYIFMLGSIEIIALVLQTMDDGYKIIYIGSAFLLAIYYTFIIETDGRFDKMTGVESNRSYYTHVEKLSKDSVYSVFLVDANGLKVINDTMGHESGDVVITSIGKALLKVFHDSGKVYRIGGDEFVVITKGPNEGIAKIMSKEFDEELERRSKIAGFEITASIGFALHKDKESYLETLHRADVDMYEKKTLYYLDADRDRRRKPEDILDINNIQ